MATSIILADRRSPLRLFCMLVGSLGRGIPQTRDPLGLLSLWDLLWDSSGIHETWVGPHVTRDTHVGLVARGWLDYLVFSWVFNLACSSTPYNENLYALLAQNPGSPMDQNPFPEFEVAACRDWYLGFPHDKWTCHLIGRRPRSKWAGRPDKTFV